MASPDQHKGTHPAHDACHPRPPPIPDDRLQRRRACHALRRLLPRRLRELRRGHDQGAEGPASAGSLPAPRSAPQSRGCAGPRTRPEQYRRRFASPAAAALALAALPPRAAILGRSSSATRTRTPTSPNDWLPTCGPTAGAVCDAPESVAAGEKWAEAINRGLEECGIFVVALTPAAVASAWVKTETSIAIELAHRHEGGSSP